MSPDASAIAEALRRRRADWLPRVFPAGVIRGGVFHLGDADGAAGGSLPIPLSPEKATTLADFSGDFRGDDLDLWARGRRMSLAEAISDAARWLGMEAGGREWKLTKTNPKRPANQESGDGAEPAPEGTPIPTGHPMVKKASGFWLYLNAARQISLIHLRFDERDKAGNLLLGDNGKPKKSFRPLIWRGGQWVSAWPTVRPLYGLLEMAARPDAPVLIVEGEKTADCARKLLAAFVVITWPQGSSGATKADWSPLLGRRVAIWPDADAPGAKAGAVVAELVRKAGAAVVALVPPPDGVQEGWDLADPLPEGWTRKTVAARIVAALAAASERAPVPTAAESAGAPPPGEEVVPPEFTDEALALQYTRQFRDFLRYVAGWGKWLEWVGTHWREDSTLRAFDLARGVCRRAAAEAMESASQRVAARCAAATTVAAVERLARADRQHAQTVGVWDADPWLLNTPGGVVDLRDGKMRRHRPELHMTKITSVAPQGHCPNWLTFLDRVTAGDEYL